MVKRKTAALVAQELVSEYFAGMLAGTGGLGIDIEQSDSMFAEVSDALRAARGDDEPSDIESELLERECGYLVGVQVGLRLRIGRVV